MYNCTYVPVFPKRVFFKSHQLTPLFTNVLGQDDAGQPGGMRGQRLQDGSAGAASVAPFLHSLDACDLWPGGGPGSKEDNNTNVLVM